MTYLQDESTRMTELTTYHTLLVPVQNKLLQAGCSILMKLKDTRTPSYTYIGSRLQLLAAGQMARSNPACGNQGNFTPWPIRRAFGSRRQNTSIP